MKSNAKLILRVLLFGVLALVALFAAWAAYLSLRYSPEYMSRELFHDLGNVYDYRFFPERKLTASSQPFHFKEAPQEAAVQQAFESGTEYGKLDTFLDSTGTQAFLVIRDDTILYERYFMGYQRDSIVTSFSVAKSFDTTLIGMAVQDGTIQSIDDPITDYIPELAERDARFRDISIRHLMLMASGLRFEPERFSSRGDDSLTYAFDDLRHLALTETQVVEPPGSRWVYNHYNPLLLGLILERTTGKPVTEYLQEKLWSPLGMEYDGSWSLDSDKSGFEKMETGINAPAIDFAKFGRLFLKQGNWDGQQLLSREWVAVATQDSGLLKDAPFYYGYMWWGKNCDGRADFFADGDHGQLIYVSQGKNLVIVRNGERYGLPNEIVGWSDLLCKFASALP